jgi:FkbM family methyltransferase
MNSLQIKARSFARKFGIIRFINHLRPGRSYEKNFHEALADAVKSGDVVWDVGANVGYYTELFCGWVGKEGQVVAFEPTPESIRSINQRLPDCTWLQVEHTALGEADTIGRLVVSGDAVENHIETEIDRMNRDVKWVPVAICRGDTMCNRLGRIPNVIKMDVEGFEEEVLQGMGEILVSPLLRSILIEVHFMKLELRGRATAPIRIEKLLRKTGFVTNWVDASHLVGKR